MENLNPISTSTTPNLVQHSGVKKWVFIFALIIVFVGLGFFVWKYAKQNHLFGASYTPEEKMEILNNLRTEPPADGSVDMTTEEKLDLLERLSSKKEVVPVSNKTQN